MFTKLSLKNFKTWRNCPDIRLAPVTMILGANSSGKSTLLQSLLLLKQTAASPDRTIHLNLGGDEANDYFNFGNFDDVLTRDVSPPREFGIALSIKYQVFNKRDPGPHKRSLDQFVDLELSYRKTSVGAPIVQTLAIRGKERRFRLERGEKGAYKLFVDDEQSSGQSRNFAPERSIALSVEALQRLGPDAAVAQDLSLVLRRELESIAYLGPLRKKPERDYAWNRSRPGLMGADGSGVMNQHVVVHHGILRARHAYFVPDL